MADPQDTKPPPRPAWVKWAAVGVAVVVVVIVVMALMGGGDHGPGRHLPGRDSGHTPPVQHAP